MPKTPPGYRAIIPQKEFERVLDGNGGNAYQAAKAWGLDHRAVAKRWQKVKERRAQEVTEPVLPVFPDGDIPIDEIRQQLARRFEKRHELAKAKEWFDIRMPNKPFGLMIWGDPHIDSNGCNWPLLERDVAIARQEGIYSLNIGDTLDNWPNGSRLVALYAHSDQSVETSHKLAKWFLEDSGIHWLVVLLGNHDLWPGHTNLRHLVKKPLIMEPWGARFTLSCGNQRFKVWAAHDFPGHSMWNTGHGMQKAAHMKEAADLYIAGHTHNWALHQEESASRDFTYWWARARGYKFIDDHADRLGHQPQKEGASILAVFNPNTTSMAGRLMCFSDVEVGAEYLAWLRAK